MEEEIITLREENARLSQDREDLIADLEECKAELFRRIPPTQISDSSIKTVFEQIHRSIDGFVYDVMEDVDDDALRHYCLELQRRGSRDPLHDFVRKANISLWGPYDCSNLYILSVVIQYILDIFVFKEPYPIGITDKQSRVLKKVEKAMLHTGQAPGQAGAHVSLDQHLNRDALGQERVDLWRSETLTALTARRENGANLEKVSREICSDHLGDLFSPWLLGAGPFAKVEERFRQEILDPAIRLHQDLKCSSYRYGYDTIPSAVLDELNPRQLFNRYDLKDADSWLKPRSEKDVGRALYNLHPSVVRLRTRGKNPIVITKPLIVVSNPNREKSWSQHGRGKSLMDGTNLPPAAAESSDAKILKVTLSDPQISAQVKADDSTASGSTSSSGRQGAPTNPPTQTQGYPYKSPQRQFPPEPSDNDLNIKTYSRSHTEEEVPSSRMSWEDQPVRPYKRGRYIPRASNTFPGQMTGRQSRQVPGREAVGTYREKSSPRRSVNEDAQPTTPPSTAVLGTSPSSVVSRGMLAGDKILMHYTRPPHRNPLLEYGENPLKRSK